MTNNIDNKPNEDFKMMVREKIEQLLSDADFEEINDIFMLAEELGKNNNNLEALGKMQENGEVTHIKEHIQKELTEEEQLLQAQMNEIFEEAEKSMIKSIENERIEKLIRKHACII